MKSRYEGSQNVLWGIRESCFFLSLLSIAEEYTGKKIDLIDSARLCMNKGLLKSDYLVCDDCKILSLLTGKIVKKEVRDHCYALRGNQYSIEKWMNREGTANHFKRRYFDVYENSRTVREGTLMCYYVYTVG